VSRIDDLIAELCPDGVEHLPMGDVGTFIRGKGLQKKDFSSTGVGCIHYGQLHTHFGVSATETLTYVSPEFAVSARMAVPGDLVVATTSEDDESVGKAVAWVGPDSVAVSSDACIFRHTLEPKFVSYFFQSRHFQRQKRRHLTGAKVRRISPDRLAKILIPAPPREVQVEIVRVLDKFVALDVELEEELEARRRQFEFYRDELVALPETDGVDWRPLGDVGHLVRGHGMPKTDFAESGVGCIHYGQIYTYYDTFATETISFVPPDKAAKLTKVDPGDVIITNTSENVDDVCKAVAWLGADQIVTGGHATVLKHDQNPKFLSYFLQSPGLHTQKIRLATGTKVIDVSATKLARIRIPIPPREAQTEIVRVLDKFELLVTDLTTGLPAEIAARRKQYEHYRDRLLTFDKLKA